jgi:hypothetical protein
MARKRLPESAPRSCLQGTEGEAVISRIESKYPLAPSGQQRGLEGDLDCIRPGYRKVDLRIHHRNPAAEALGDLGAQPMGMCVGETMKKPPGLSPDGTDYGRVAMPDRGDAETRGEIDIAIAIDILDIRAQSLIPDQRRATGAERVDSRSFVTGKLAGEPTRLGTGRIMQDARRKVASAESGHGSELSASRQGSSEGHLVGVLDVTTDWHPEGESGYTNSVLLEESSEIEGRGFSFHVGIGGQDDLLDALEALHEPGDAQLIRTDATLWGECPHQDVVAAVELSRALDGLNVVGLFDDTDTVRVTLRIAAEITGLDIGDRVAERTVEEFVLDLENRRGERLRIGPGDLEQVMGEPGGRLGTDAWKAGELSNECG